MESKALAHVNIFTDDISHAQSNRVKRKDCRKIYLNLICGFGEERYISAKNEMKGRQKKRGREKLKQE